MECVNSLSKCRMLRSAPIRLLLTPQDAEMGWSRRADELADVFRRLPTCSLISLMPHKRGGADEMSIFRKKRLRRRSLVCKLLETVGLDELSCGILQRAIERNMVRTETSVVPSARRT